MHQYFAQQQDLLGSGGQMQGAQFVGGQQQQQVIGYQETPQRLAYSHRFVAESGFVYDQNFAAANGLIPLSAPLVKQHNELVETQAFQWNRAIQPSQQQKKRHVTDLSQYINPLVHEKAAQALHAHYAPDDTYKTVMCEKWLETANCGFGTNCRFAHGEEELRHRDFKPRMAGNRKYKTRLCEKFNSRGICPYGRRCLFIHPEVPLVQQHALRAEDSVPASQHTLKQSTSLDHRSTQYDIWTTPSLGLEATYTSTPFSATWASNGGSGTTGTTGLSGDSPAEEVNHISIDPAKKGHDSPMGCMKGTRDRLARSIANVLDVSDVQLS